MGARASRDGGAETTPIPGCTDCGACCFSPQRDYIRVFEIDVGRMDPATLAWTEVRDGRRAMRMELGRCAALLLDADARTFRCSIYEARPDVCRSLERASGGCLQQRSEKAGQALIALGAPRPRDP